MLQSLKSVEPNRRLHADALHARQFLAEHPEEFPAVLRASTSDVDLAELAAEVDCAGDEHGFALVATAGVLREHRTALVAALRVRLGRLGDRYAELAAELRRVGDERVAALHELAACRAEPEWDAAAGEYRYAQLARLARMTRQAARERLGGTAPADEVLDEDIATEVRRHLRQRDMPGTGGTGTSAAVLHELVTTRFPGASRSRLDAVLRRMVEAGEAERRGTVVGMYHYTTEQLARPQK